MSELWSSKKPHAAANYVFREPRAAPLEDRNSISECRDTEFACPMCGTHMTSILFFGLDKYSIDCIYGHVAHVYQEID